MRAPSPLILMHYSMGRVSMLHTNSTLSLWCMHKCHTTVYNIPDIVHGIVTAILVNVGGSWSQSCSPQKYKKGGMLVAICGGTPLSELFPSRLKQTTINASLCSGGLVTNKGGQLVCSNGVAVGLPGESGGTPPIHSLSLPLMQCIHI